MTGPLSLAQLFEPPEGMTGIFGWMCGYSADQSFLNDAAERFARQSRSQRAYGGRLYLAIMLDPGNSAITTVAAPGVIHLPMNEPERRRYSLLHAKVAVLAFHEVSDPDHWHLRLIVSTANWTRSSLVDSIDVAWRADVCNGDLEKPDEFSRQICSDIDAAWTFLNWLSGSFDTSVLAALPPGRDETETTHAQILFLKKLELVGLQTNKPKPRFFDNRNSSLLHQLPKLVTKRTRRNYLAFASGYYQGESDARTVPSVLTAILRVLEDHELVTAEPEMDVFVNTKACQAVASSAQAMADAGYTIKAARAPTDYFGAKSLRTLHAKFLFGANYRENSNVCHNAWMYLGSGNFTNPGFLQSALTERGNLEAGVVFAPKYDCYWWRKNCPDLERLITNILPIDLNSSKLDLAVDLSHGGEMPEREVEFLSSPVGWFLWSGIATPPTLSVPLKVIAPFDVIGSDGKNCNRDKDGNFIWLDRRPRQVDIIWQENGKNRISTVPVVDEFGRIASQELQLIDLEEAWWQLSNFPMQPDEEDLPTADENDEDRTVSSYHTAASAVSSFPIRQMMHLVEMIAAKQVDVPQVNWASWCLRLEQTLVQSSTNSCIPTFHAMSLNPLSPLWHPPFRPPYAETISTVEGQRYESALRRIEESWHIAGLRRVGTKDG